MMELTHLNKALKNGGKLHGFRSGGGLRVFRVEDRNGESIGYGEHPAALDALAHTNLWLEQDPKPSYKDFYGGKFPHYVTGSTHSSDALDAWLKRGSTVDARQDGDDVVVELHGYSSSLRPTLKVGRGVDFFAAVDAAFEAEGHETDD